MLYAPGAATRSKALSCTAAPVPAPLLDPGHLCYMHFFSLPAPPRVHTSLRGASGMGPWGASAHADGQQGAYSRASRCIMLISRPSEAGTQGLRGHGCESGGAQHRKTVGAVGALSSG